VKPLTDPGTVLGTAGYMSPEQVRGENVDARSDIFSLGTILYEMVSGRRAFRGTSSVDTMHAILHEDPPELLQTNAQIPPALQRIVHHCLEKDPEQRFQSARDLAFDLSSMSGSSAEMIAPKRRARAPAATMWIAAIVVAAIAGWFASRAMQRPPKMPAFRRVTFHSLGVPAAAFSADQQSVVFSSVGDRRAGDIYVSAIGSPEMRSMGLPGACVLAASKNGELAVLLDPHFLGGFLIPGTLARVPLGGGAPRQLANDVQWADWTPDGNDLMILREVGGKTRIELPIGNVVFETTSWISTPRMSPDGKSIAFIEHPQTGNDAGFIAVIGPDHKKKTLTPPYASAFGLAWHPDGKEIWYTAAESGNARQLWAVGLSGTPRLVIQMPGIAQIHDIARDGRVLLTQNDTHIRLFARGPNDFNDRELSWLDWSLLRDVSTDGRWILFDESGEGGGKAGGVYIRNADGSPAVRLGDGLAAGFSPDGKSVLARHFNEKPGQIYLYPIGPGDARQLTHDDLDHEFTSWVPDGKSIAFRASVAGRPPRLYVQSVAGGAPRPISPEGVSGYLICSPDGRWVHGRGPDRAPTLYRTDGGAEIKLPAMVPEAVVIGWSPDGKSLRYYLRSANPAPVYTLEVATGRSRLWKEIALPEGSFGALNMRTSADGKTYAYSVVTNAADLYLLEGVK
jgi:Tol biopolymer transport system component